MDIAISKNKKSLNTKHVVLILALAVLTYFVLQYLWYLSKADFNVDRDSIVVDEVKRGKYTVSVRGSGVLVPDNIQYISAEVESTVERLILKPGKIVKEGDLIVELKNPQLVQQLEEAKWELEAMEEEFKAAEVDQESRLQQQEASVLEANLNVEQSQLEYEARKQLVKTGAVSKLDYQRSRLTLNQSKQRRQAIGEELAKMKENLIAQTKARVARLKSTRKMVDRLQQQVNDLQVRATMDAIVLEIPLEPGQRVMMGASIVKLAEQNSLIAELQVPEITIRDVSVGQRVVIDTRNSEFDGVVSRIDPAVINGNVQVDVEFPGDLPNDARPDLSVNGEIKITEITDTLYVDRPLFAQSRSNSFFYKLSEDGRFAERVDVTVGYGSVSQIQILGGLQVGDKIVTSDPTRFERYEKFRIN